MTPPNKLKLITVLGSSPAVITETLYALKDESIFPSSIDIFTTAHGNKTFHQQNMLMEISNLCKEYDLPNIPEKDIKTHVVTVPFENGEELEDIRNRKDQEAMADFLTKKISEFCKVESTAIHASIAGGRKSMSFYMGYIFSMFARSQDRLSHVLVESNYESSSFKYPTPYSKPLINSFNNEPKLVNGKQLDAKDATNAIELAEVPFICMNIGHQLPSEITRYSEIVAVYQLSLTPEKTKLTLKKQSHVILVNDKELELDLLTYAFYRLAIENSFNNTLETLNASFDKGAINKKDADTSKLLSDRERYIDHVCEILAGIVNYPYQANKDGSSFDHWEELFDQCESSGYRIDGRTGKTIIEEGITPSQFNALKSNIKKALEKVAIGKTVELCSVRSVSSNVNESSAEYRSKPSINGYIGISLNPKQIQIIE